ncbi:MAG: hypothetical protein F6K19_01065 [Cyanothece sp. SIO1E1]|nr:hypothetical protein [Cyanothece sp. SIO1E1]
MNRAIQPFWLGAVLSAGLVVAPKAVAVDLPPCQPPADNEYLLLVISETEPEQARVRDALAPNTTSTLCNYLDDVVVRIGGFTSLETANAWAQEFMEVSGMQAFVAQPSEPAAPNQNLPDYQPQALASGYAVLVDYSNRPEVAAEIQQVLTNPIGLVAYRQRPFLLAVYTPDANIAGTTLLALSRRQFAAIMVDSQQVVLLTPNVTPP